MKTRNFYARKVENGQSVFAPSITQPDLSYSIRDLVEKYSVDQLPPMALLQPFFDEEEVDEDYMAAIRGADRADRSFFAMQNVKLRDSIIDKVKQMHEWRKARSAKYTSQDSAKAETATDAPNTEK